jgi:ABC-type transport system involved in multi-copper enzyme maturation permease subunit
MLICNEYTYRTHRQNIIDGWSRSQFITSKLMDVLIISVLITVIYAAVALVTGLYNQERLIHDTWGQVHYIALFGLQTFSQLSIAFLLGFLIRKAFLALGVFLFYFIILENIIYGLLEWKKSPVANYLPLQISDGMIPKPAFWGKLDAAAYQRSIDVIPEHIILTILLTAVLWLICYRVNSRRDLK